MLKKLSLILIVAVLACSQVGYYFIARHQQQEQKEAIREKIFGQLKENELEMISITADQNIYWEENGKEFLLNGHMYDVVKTKAVNGKTVFLCINDRKEKALVDNYNSITKQNSSSDKKGKSIIDNSISLFVYQDEKETANNFSAVAVKFTWFNACIVDNVMNKVSPPPKARFHFYSFVSVTSMMLLFINSILKNEIQNFIYTYNFIYFS